jgi:hypothetical protein
MCSVRCTWGASLRTHNRAEPGLQATGTRGGRASTHSTSRTRRLLVIAALLLPLPLAGQRTAELQARADSLLHEWRQANVLAAVQDSLRAAANVAGRDTLRVGALMILANPSPLPLTRAATRAWPMIERFYGPAAQALARHPIVIQAVDPDTAVLTAPPGSGLRIPWDEDPDHLTRVLVGSADLGSDDRGLHDWLRGPLTPSIDIKPVLGRVYIQLVIAPSQAARRCFAGALDACRDALSLADTAGLIARWYNPAERRLLVTTQLSGFFNRGAQEAAFRSCAAGSDSACTDLLESIAPGNVPSPLDHGARYALVATAIALGGPETFSRLLAAPDGPVGSRLAQASRLSEDSLVARWRADVLAARPKPVSLPPWGGWIALMWAGVFMGCALRSSRWRVS